jgi:hypothetical protein
VELTQLEANVETFESKSNCNAVEIAKDWNERKTIARKFWKMN